MTLIDRWKIFQSVVVQRVRGRGRVRRQFLYYHLFPVF